MTKYKEINMGRKVQNATNVTFRDRLNVMTGEEKVKKHKPNNNKSS